MAEGKAVFSCRIPHFLRAYESPALDWSSLGAKPVSILAIMVLLLPSIRLSTSLTLNKYFLNRRTNELVNQ